MTALAGFRRGAKRSLPDGVFAYALLDYWSRMPHAGSVMDVVFDIDMQHCPNCGAGELKIIAAILERPVFEKTLTHLGLDPHPP